MIIYGLSIEFKTHVSVFYLQKCLDIEMSDIAFCQQVLVAQSLLSSQLCVQARDRLAPPSCSALPSLISAMDCICLVSC